MSKFPLVSIVIPIYRVENFIAECIYSILSQSYSNIELILVDDCGGDKSVNIALEIIEQYPRDIKYKLVQHDKNRGLSAARNSGIEEVSGEFVFFIDSDDFISENTIERLLLSFNDVYDIGIVSAPCFYSFYDNKEKIFREDWNIKTQRVIDYNSFCLLTLAQACNHSACAKLYRKELLSQIRFREGIKNEDTLFMFDISKVMIDKKISMLEIPDALYHYRFNPESITHNKNNIFIKSVVDNLCVLRNETSNSEILKVIEKQYYIELVSFISLLLSINDDYGENLRQKYLAEYVNKLKSESSFKILKRSSLWIAFKAFIFKNFISASISVYKFRNIVSNYNINIF